MWLKDLLCGYNALNHLEIVLWTPVLESDQVKYTADANFVGASSGIFVLHSFTNFA
jgi:hypothetical protein